MIIVSQDKEKIINFDNVEYIEIGQYTYGGFYLMVSFKSIDKTIGTYETEERAKEILMDIYSKLVDEKKNYKMPED